MKTLLILLTIGCSSLLLAESHVTKTPSGVTVIRGAQRHFFTGLLKKKNRDVRGLGETYATYDCPNLPDEFDLRDVGVVGPVRDQGQCGSCWAFSQTASLESAFAASGGGLGDLSEQQIVSCDRNNYGCNGGNLNGFQFQIKSGQTGEEKFKYSESNGTCKSNLPMATKGISYVNVGHANGRASEQQVMCALYMSETIPWITVSASDGWSSPPTSSTGVYNNCGGGETNHAVGLVGWKKVNGKVYFKVRNSWGNNWGSNANRPDMERGYMMMPLGCDSLGDEVAYIVAGYARHGCSLPQVKLPSQVDIQPGDETKIGVRGEPGVSYEWFAGEESVGRGDTFLAHPTSTTIYKLVGKNHCGQAESLVRVKVTPRD